MLGRWKRQLAHQNTGVYRGTGPLADDQAELQQWRTEVTRLRMERALEAGRPFFRQRIARY
jgi:hypothetical protein